MRTLLLPLSHVYGAGVAVRLALYERGVFGVRHAARPVVSVGNIASGGTGKTPFVRWLAGELLRRGRHPSILTRGYGRTSRGTVVVSDGRGTLATVAASGDEPALLARALPFVPIVADARRALAASRAETLEAPVDVHLLDDGFSHVGLAREVDIVLLDATAPDAGRRPPAGRPPARAADVPGASRPDRRHEDRAGRPGLRAGARPPLRSRHPRLPCPDGVPRHP
ncbi:MAG: tetraacyldisaccharide 4'-kinase [Holophagales bacterium]|nr:tetraacyldisaccharide 4'-kinase [Holophagales bacterium]